MLNSTPYKKTIFIIFLILSIFIVGSSLYHFSYINDKDLQSSFFLQIIKSIQNFIFFLLLFSIITKKYHPDYLFYIFPVAVLEQQFSIFSTFIADLFINNLPINFTEFSREYFRIIFFIFILLWGTIYILKTKSRNHIFLFLASTSTLLTSILFHTIIVKQLDYYTFTQKSQIFNIQNLTNREDINTGCYAINIECFNLENIHNLNDIQIPEKLKIQITQNIAPLYKNKEHFYYYFIFVSTEEQNRLSSRLPFAILKNKNSITLAIDQNNYKHYLIFNQYIFATLSFFAHLVWVLGSLFLIYFHEKKIKNQRRPSQ